MLRFMHSPGIARAGARTTGCGRSSSRSASGCSARRSRTGGSSSPATTWPTTGSSTPTRPTRFVDEIGIRSMVVAPTGRRRRDVRRAGHVLEHRDAFTAPQVALVRALSDHAALRDGQRPPHRGARALARGDRAPGDPRALAARARHPDLRRARPRRRSSSTRSRRRSGCSTATGRGSTSSTPRSACSAACTRPATSGSSSPTGRAIPRTRLEVGASRPRRDHRPDLHQPRLPDRRATSSTATDPTRTPGTRASAASSPRRCSATRARSGRSRCGRPRRTRSTPDDAVLLETIAGQSAVALGRARLIEELGRSREALARRAEEERALREIASRLGAMGDDPADILNRIVHETARLLGGERARLDLLEPLSGSWLWTYPPETPFNDRIVAAELVAGGADGRPTGLAGLAIREGRPVASGDYMHDERFRHYTEGDRGVTEVGLHSIVATPVDRRGGAARRPPGRASRGATPSATTPRGSSRALACAGHDRDHQRPPRRPARVVPGGPRRGPRTSERALREIARRMMVIQDPAELLQDVVDEAARLLGSSGAVIDLLDPATGEVRWAYDAGIEEATRAEWQRRGVGGDGVFLAIRERRVVTTDDYAADERFRDGADERRLLRGCRGPLDRVRAARSARPRCWARSRSSPASRAASGRTRRRRSPRSPTSRRSRSTTRS